MASLILKSFSSRIRRSRRTSDYWQYVAESVRPIGNESQKKFFGRANPAGLARVIFIISCYFINKTFFALGVLQ